MRQRYTGRPIVKPIPPKRAPLPGSLAIMVATAGDMRNLRKRLGIPAEPVTRLFASQLLLQNNRGRGLSIVGPFVGAPYATMILETLVVCGVERVVFFGWCGGVSPQVEIGDIVLPDQAIIDEGTSCHYQSGTGDGRCQTGVDGYAEPAASVTDRLRKGLETERVKFHEGAIWSTDAIFRETAEKVKYYQERGALAVEMEVSALFAAGRFHNIAVGGILAVSDSVAGYTWRQGFKDPRFQTTRQTINRVIGQICQTD